MLTNEYISQDPRAVLTGSMYTTKRIQALQSINLDVVGVVVVVVAVVQIGDWKYLGEGGSMFQKQMLKAQAGDAWAQLWVGNIFSWGLEGIKQDRVAAKVTTTATIASSMLKDLIGAGCVPTMQRGLPALFLRSVPGMVGEIRSTIEPRVPVSTCVT
jgi:hypothetical protein